MIKTKAIRIERSLNKSKVSQKYLLQESTTLRTHPVETTRNFSQVKLLIRDKKMETAK